MCIFSGEKRRHKALSWLPRVTDLSRSEDPPWLGFLPGLFCSSEGLHESSPTPPQSGQQLFGEAESYFTLSSRNVIASLLVKEISAFESHGKAQSTLSFSITKIPVPSPRRSAVLPALHVASETDRNKLALRPVSTREASVLVGDGSGKVTGEGLLLPRPNLSLGGGFCWAGHVNLPHARAGALQLRSPGPALPCPLACPD